MIVKGRVFAAAVTIAASAFGLAACSSTTSKSAAERQWNEDAKACEQIQDATQRQSCQAQASARFQMAVKAERKAQAGCPSSTC